MSEFQIVEINQGNIITNFEETKEELNRDLDVYRNLEVTEDFLPTCKDKRSELRKKSKEIDTLRKQVKAKWIAPLTEFEGKCKELQGIIEEVVTPIDEGIKEFDEKARQEKLEKARDLVEEVAKKMNFSEIDEIEVDPSWGNVSKSQKSIKDEITSQIQLILEKRRNEERRIEMFKALVEAENTRLNEKISIEMFRDAIEGDTPDAEIIKIIKNTADLVYTAENAQKDKQVGEEPKEADTGEKQPLKEEGYLIRIYNDESTADEVVNILMENGFFAKRI